MSKRRMAVVVCCTIFTAVEGAMADTDWAKMKGMTASAKEFTATLRTGASLVHVRQDSKLWVDSAK